MHCDCRRLYNLRGEEIDQAEIAEANNQRAVGTWVMGTASTMAMIAETLGLMPPVSVRLLSLLNNVELLSIPGDGS